MRLYSQCSPVAIQYLSLLAPQQLSHSVSILSSSPASLAISSPRPIYIEFMSIQPAPPTQKVTHHVTTNFLVACSLLYLDQPALLHLTLSSRGPKNKVLHTFILRYLLICVCVILGVFVQRASKATRARSTSTTVKITTVRTTPPASMESTTTHACAHQNTQVTHD